MIQVQSNGVVKVRVHPNGAFVLIDRKAGTIAQLCVGEGIPREVYSLKARWVRKFTKCRVCKKPVSDEVLATAYWRLEVQACSPECRSEEIRKRYACCKKAERSFCVCTYSFKCPVHGETHVGSHD